MLSIELEIVFGQNHIYESNQSLIGGVFSPGRCLAGILAAVMMLSLFGMLV